MKKYQILIYVLILFSVIFFIAIYNANKNSNNAKPNDNVSLTKTSTDINEEYSENKISSIIENKNEILQNDLQNSLQNENEISSFSTDILDKSEGRLTNINITCSTLNDTIIKKGATFSFNETIGNPTVEKGYKEASIIIDHKTKKGIGGRKLPSKFNSI